MLGLRHERECYSVLFEVRPTVAVVRFVTLLSEVSATKACSCLTPANPRQPPTSQAKDAAGQARHTGGSRT